MPPTAADDSLLSNSSASSVDSASQAPTEGAGDESASSSGQSTPAIDPDQTVDEVTSEGLDGPSNPGSDNGSDAHLDDDEFREKMDRDVLRLGEVTEEEGKKIKREEWLVGLRAAALAAAPSSNPEKDEEEDGEETEDGARRNRAQAEAGQSDLSLLGKLSLSSSSTSPSFPFLLLPSSSQADLVLFFLSASISETAFLRLSRRYLTKQLKSIDQDDWKYDSATNADRLFVPSFGGKLDMAAGATGEKDQSGMSMKVVDEEEEVWGRGARGR